MSAMSTTAARGGAVFTLTAALVAGGTSLTPDASAATAAQKALKVAASKKGAPYRYGGTGPNSFDCSGLVQYAYKKAGKRLPRTTTQQYNATRHISKNSRKLGDLVFFYSGRSIYHVGLYAGKGRIWHSPKPGRSVKLERIWTGKTKYGRVR